MISLNLRLRFTKCKISLRSPVLEVEVNKWIILNGNTGGSSNGSVKFLDSICFILKCNLSQWLKKYNFLRGFRSYSNNFPCKQGAKLYHGFVVLDYIFNVRMVWCHTNHICVHHAQTFHNTSLDAVAVRASMLILEEIKLLMVPAMYESHLPCNINSSFQFLLLTKHSRPSVI